MAYWLFKTEPSEFSIDALKKAPQHIATWDGVRNYQVRNMLRDQIKVGDFVLFYHSSCDDIGIAGVAEVVKAAFPDPTQFNPESKYYDPKSPSDSPRWLAVDIKFKEKFPHLIPLATLKTQSALAEMTLLKRGNRLSITPVSFDEWRVIMRLAYK